MERFVVDGLRETLVERVIVAGDPSYDETRATFNATVQRKPGVIVQPRTTDEVVKAVVAAGDLGLAIGVRGGGHSVAGHAMADGALVVDLRQMRAVTVDPVARIVRAEGGALWMDVDDAAWKHHLAVVGGTFGDTGIGGLTLGGGIGWLMGVAGFTCDNLIRAEVVTADGEVVIAGPDGDPELLWALRGGGGNFGVVTRFEYSAVDPGDVVAGHIRYPLSSIAQVLRRISEVSASARDGLLLAAGFPSQPIDGQPTISVSVAWTGDGSLADEVIHPLRTGLPVLEDDVAPVSYLDLQAMAGTFPFGLRHYWKGAFLKELREPEIGVLAEAAAKVPGGFTFILIESIRGKAHREPDGGAAFGQRAANWNASALGVWEDPAEDAAQIAWARATVDRLLPYSLSGAGYANYAPVDETIERVRAAFGDERFARLAAVKARYDPKNRFRFNLNIAPG